MWLSSWTTGLCLRSYHHWLLPWGLMVLWMSMSMSFRPILCPTQGSTSCMLSSYATPVNSDLSWEAFCTWDHLWAFLHDCQVWPPAVSCTGDDVVYENKVVTNIAKSVIGSRVPVILLFYKIHKKYLKVKKIYFFSNVFNDVYSLRSKISVGGLVQILY